ncbi:MAG: UDP-N-acetylglucosamine--N-acetylmuramyl-(pentapeptide) pyrophosphoryl-undecaprenol N-acetylglucosamine transferase [Elusimicrobiota bacterium]|jgi:UDP-N-acetylglucosamine--N-acetylmuramyl-(pentapeptide) pyrophosphoryl-undecaprenol N-acetylglucosamine transferase|nr:UDP-N-acetylglucosamine--N-acetylmuramyl-(pentapeptide) pyrophosphoryl-undecaprenol N-acetylglucosamine transferase [Elusimicrobiota bacterium]
MAINKNIIIAASGTGGHIYPGLTIAAELKNRGFNPVFFISNNSASRMIIENSGFEYIAFNLSGMPRKISLAFLIFCFKLIFSTIKAFKNIIVLKPFCALSTGGYIGVPTIFAARILGKKTYLHEQNTIAGKANRYLSLIADKVLISFEGSAKYFNHKKTILTGYPIRKVIFKADKKTARQTLQIDDNVFTIFIFGGSLGAKRLNEISFDAMRILSLQEKIQVIHISGEKDYKNLSQKAQTLPYYRVIEYMRDIYNAYAAADIIISRAGAGSVFEIKTLNKPAILIPLPTATDNHQYYNAKESESDYIKVLEEGTLTAQKLTDTIISLKEFANLQKENNISNFPQEIISDMLISANPPPQS